MISRHFIHLYRKLRRKGWSAEQAARRARSHALVLETLTLRASDEVRGTPQRRAAR